MKVCVLTNPKNTVWDPKESQIDQIFDIVVQPSRADIWVANQEGPLRDQLEKSIQANTRKPKACILWTHEPYFSTTTQTQIKLYDCPVFVFNVWNGRALKQNGTFLFQKGTLPPRPDLRSEWRSQGKKICALMTYPKSDASFTQNRLQIVLSGHQAGALDIYGKGWPQGMTVGNSRDGEWWNTKPAILEKYDFNVALENSIQPFYVTEKLWDSIACGTLPIYSDNGTIYKDFVKGSFLDVQDFSTTEKLWECISSMSHQEWSFRMGQCIGAMEGIWERQKSKGQLFWQESIEEIQKELNNLDL